MTGLTEQQRRDAIDAMHAAGVPSCEASCLTTRDLYYCGPCTDCDEGMHVYCVPCLAQHREDAPDCREDMDTPSNRIKPTFRFAIEETDD